MVCSNEADVSVRQEESTLLSMASHIQTKIDCSLSDREHLRVRKDAACQCWI